MRGVKVLGKIDLRKPTAPAPSPAARGAEPAPGTEAAAADGAPKKKKGRKVIKKSDMLDTMERDFMRGGKRPQKRRALPGKEQKKTEITVRSEEHTSELQSLAYLVCRLLLEKKKRNSTSSASTTAVR